MIIQNSFKNQAIINLHTYLPVVEINISLFYVIFIPLAYSYISLTGALGFFPNNFIFLYSSVR